MANCAKNPEIQFSKVNQTYHDVIALQQHAQTHLCIEIYWLSNRGVFKYLHYMSLCVWTSFPMRNFNSLTLSCNFYFRYTLIIDEEVDFNWIIDFTRIDQYRQKTQSMYVSWLWLI